MATPAVVDSALIELREFTRPGATFRDIRFPVTLFNVQGFPTLLARLVGGNRIVVPFEWAEMFAIEQQNPLILEFLQWADDGRGVRFSAAVEVSPGVRSLEIGVGALLAAFEIVTLQGDGLYLANPRATCIFQVS